MNALEGIGIESAQAAEAARRAEEEKAGKANFLELLVAQLENQDPLNPQDSAAFASQLAQFSSVEQLVAVRAGVDELVAAANSAGGDSSGTSGIDPTNLVGKEVVVFGSQIEVDAQRTPITMPIRTVETAADVEVRIYDEAGTLRYSSSILPVDEAEEPIALRAGDHEFVFDPAEHNLAEGVYAIQFAATGVDGEEVVVLPTLSGIVTGAILDNEPRIRVGNRIFSLADVLEVKLPGSPGANTIGSGRSPGTGPSGPIPYQTGGGQTARPMPNGAMLDRPGYGAGA